MYDTAFELIIGHEGGYVNDPRDPGGETKYGISKRAYPNVDIAALTLADAKSIYKSDYWDACDCDGFGDDGLALIVFDTAVNQGNTIAKKLLQKAVGVDDDGVIGPITLAAVQAANPRTALREYTLFRMLRYAGTNNFDRYGKGWFRRALSILLDGVDASSNGSN